MPLRCRVSASYPTMNTGGAMLTELTDFLAPRSARHWATAGRGTRWPAILFYGQRHGFSSENANEPDDQADRRLCRGVRDSRDGRERSDLVHGAGRHDKEM